MPAPTFRRVARSVAAVIVLACCGGLTGCGGAKDDGPARPVARPVSVTVTAKGCTPAPATVPAGAVDFTVTNRGAPAVTEIELAKEGDPDILAARGDLRPGGAARTFSLWLTPGTYGLGCNGAAGGTARLTVTGQPAAEPLDEAQGSAAIRARQHLIDRSSDLAALTKVFTKAVRARDRGAAKNAYGPAHLVYEELEFVVDRIGGGALDTAIDARRPPEGGRTWTGFHRLESALWGRRSWSGTARLASRLDADIAKLRAALALRTFQPAELANGAASSLDESLQLHLRAAEDGLSRTALWDVAGKYQAAVQLFVLLKPAVEERDSKLARRVSTTLDDLGTRLRRLRVGNRYFAYNTVTAADRAALTRAAENLRTALSAVPAVVV